MHWNTRSRWSIKDTEKSKKQKLMAPSLDMVNVRKTVYFLPVSIPITNHCSKIGTSFIGPQSLNHNFTNCIDQVGLPRVRSVSKNQVI